MTTTIQFLGAARQVTGSKHLLTINGRKILLDCGMVQGPRRTANKLNSQLPFRAEEVDAVLVSHAHIDHSGSLPLLVKEGFQGSIHCTHATKDLLSILLPDSAYLQASDARHLTKRGHRFEPPYSMEDVEQTMATVQGIGYGKSIEVCPGVRATFLDAGHILGSAHVVVDVEDGPHSMRIVFTGDHGRKGMPILRDPEPLPECDVLITESTYGDRLHPPLDELENQLAEFLTEQRGRGGRVLIPAFSVGRTQNILWYLGRMIDEGVIDPLPIYVDSPLSSKATAIAARHQELFDRQARDVLASGRDPFFFDGVKCVADVNESKALNQLRSGIIISASGMCEGGRILHHLEQTIDRPEDCILIVGYQAQGTLGRKLLEGYEYVKIYGERHKVRCKVHHIDGLSAHADYREMLEHVRPLARTTKQVFVVHGEENPALKFADHLLDAGFRSVEVPLYKETFTLRP